MAQQEIFEHCVKHIFFLDDIINIIISKFINKKNLKYKGSDY